MSIYDREVAMLFYRVSSSDIGTVILSFPREKNGLYLPDGTKLEYTMAID